MLKKVAAPVVPGLSVPDHGFGARKSEQAAPGGGLP